MTHLTHEELVQWRMAGTPEERSRVLAHLAACGDCRRAYADLVRLEPQAIAPADNETDLFVKRGIAAYDRLHARPWWRSRTLWIAVPAAAAAMLVVALNLPRSQAPLSEPSMETRGGAITAVSPAGPLDGVTEFRWSSQLTAVRYRLVVRDAGGQEILSRETDQDRMPVDAAAAPALRSGRYTWLVEARDANGRILAVSRPQSFIVN